MAHGNTNTVGQPVPTPGTATENMSIFANEPTLLSATNGGPVGAHAFNANGGGFGGNGMFLYTAMPD